MQWWKWILMGVSASILCYDACKLGSSAVRGMRPRLSLMLEISFFFVAEMWCLRELFGP